MGLWRWYDVIGQWPTHTYNRAGTYTVSLTFTSPDITLSNNKRALYHRVTLAHYYPPL